jgi:hypothetical protein
MTVRFSWRILAGLALAAGLFVSQPATAQGSDEEAARNLFREGLALHEAHDFASAIEKYRQAYARWKNPKILTNIGTAAWELGRFADAAEAYDRYLVDAPAGDSNRAGVEKALKDIIPKVGTANVHVTGGSAVITVDGHSLDLPILDRIRVDPGSHAFEAIGAGGIRARQVVDVPAGSTVDVSLVLAARESGAPAPPPDVSGTAAAAGAKPSSSPLPWIVGGIGVAGLATSGVLFAMRGSAVSDLEQHCLGNVCPSSQGDTIDRANRLGTFSAIALGVGVAGIGTSIFLLTRHPDDSRRATRGPVIAVAAAPGAAFAVAGARF